MSTDADELIEALTLELARCEGLITRLYVILDRAGLLDGDPMLADAIYERQRAIADLVRKVREITS